MSEYGRLRWRSRRGMLELDLLLRNFLEKRFSSLDEADKSAYGALLEYPDDELWDIISGREPPEERFAKIVGLVLGSN